MNKRRLGIIQSRGLGDIIIALPIAGYYRDQGYSIDWCIGEQFLASVESNVPWINWIPLSVDHGLYFYDTPRRRLKNLGCDPILCLYQNLSSLPELQALAHFQIVKFDQSKYIHAGVPFWLKWDLRRLITRQPDREQALYDRLVQNPSYVVLHLEGSDHQAEFDRSILPPEWQQIEITADHTENIWDWLMILERAQVIVTVDSVFANLIDQWQLTESVDCYLIPRSHIQLTPVLGGSWTYLDPSAETRQRISIFR